MTEPLKPSMRITGGDPVMPKGSPPFKPLNPWGRGFPKRPPKPDTSMWVCSVFDKDTRQRVNIGLCGPKVGAEMLAAEVRHQDSIGKSWATDPQVVRVIG